MSTNALLLQILTGLSRAAILFIVAAGLSLVFGAMRIVNIAHGSFYMLGAFLAVTVAGAVAGPFGFVAALVVAPLIVAVVGGVIEVSALRRLYGKEHLLQLLATFAVLLVLHDAVRWFYGERPRSLRAPEFARGSVDLAGTIYPRYGLFIIVAALLIAGGLWALMSRTGLGRDIRAAVSDPEMLGMVGVDVRRLFTIVFMLGAALGGIGGVLAAPQTTLLLGMDVDIIVQSFAVVIIGGLGSLLGTAVGAVLVGVTFALGIVWFPSAAMAIVFLVMVAVLVVRPTGLFGIPEA
ncbi:branched-chain amino acid ABC transporter permease [Egicoccus sp. AB-alg6-2]|uniref:branched-chain amino acid ABC transporter permease n=1 Tax=Egicoccus sp. AB-alg6-2 TaxID=3242692 RepID=UPI00359D6A2E